jgi:hypothetical protein
MSEKKSGQQGESEASSSTNLPPDDQPLEDILERLPTQHREELKKQYELPDVKVGILDIFRYATPFEVALQILGLIMAIVQGTLSFVDSPLTQAPHYPS